MIKELNKRDHKMTFDWTKADYFDRPYTKHLADAAQLATTEIEAIAEAEFFIIVGDPGGTGMYVEMGAALANNVPIYAIGHHSDETIFHFHSSVTRLGDFSALLGRIN